MPEFVFSFDTLSNAFNSEEPLSNFSNRCLVLYNKSDSNLALLFCTAKTGISLINWKINMNEIKNTIPSM